MKPVNVLLNLRIVTGARGGDGSSLTPANTISP